MDLFEHAAQPICPECGVTMHPEDGRDECRECGYRIEWPEAQHPGYGDDIADV
ncbi:hypothetical protein [Microbacterium sp. G2-8]|uniref:hypothetical protein n=1 Tax=Microbacterium sp. G2-8 TaxID=2842454 RepID=UPI001C893930|nr:hypothetical protein [Microbacterium sp. G2-8]